MDTVIVREWMRVVGVIINSREKGAEKVIRKVDSGRCIFNKDFTGLSERNSKLKAYSVGKVSENYSNPLNLRDGKYHCNHKILLKWTSTI